MIDRYSRPEMKQVWSDENKYKKWLEVEIAVCEAWAEEGSIPRNAIPKIKMAKINFKRMEEILKETRHDVTAFLGAIQESLGEESRYVHMGLTSHDVWDTATSLQLMEASDILVQDVKNLTAVLAQRAIEHKYTLTIGRTHGVHAEPTTFGLKLAIWVEEMRRNLHRLNEAKKIISVGKISGAVGTYATVPPQIEQSACKKLGIEPAPVSNQILQRDRHAEFITTLAIITGSMEKFATEIRNLQKTEVHEVEEPFGQPGFVTTGSSAMPHKRNPELTERICGISRLVRGYALTSLENIALWHERDISHSSNERITFPDACLILDYAIALFTSVMQRLQVFPHRMKKNLELTKGLVFSQRVMLGLIDKGMSRQDAYKVAQRNATKAWQGTRSFTTLIKNDPDVAKMLTSAELDKIFDYQYYTQYVDEIFVRLGLTKSQWGIPDNK